MVREEEKDEERDWLILLKTTAGEGLNIVDIQSHKIGTCKSTILKLSERSRASL